MGRRHVVATSTGFNDNVWLENSGTGRRTLTSPSASGATISATWTWKITIDDPKTYTKPWTVTPPGGYQPDSELINICARRTRRTSRTWSASKALEGEPNVRRLTRWAASLLVAAHLTAAGPSPTADIDVLHYALTITPDFDTRSVSGETHVSFRSQRDALADIRFSGNSLTVDARRSRDSRLAPRASTVMSSSRCRSPLPGDKRPR